MTFKYADLRPLKSMINLAGLSCLLMRIVWLASIFVVCAMPVGCQDSSEESNVLMVFCAASLQQPITELASRFQQQHAVRIQLQFGGTSLLINQSKLTHHADVLISADQFSTDRMVGSGLCSDCRPVVIQTPVIVTTDKASEKVLSRADLFRENVKVGLGSIEATSIGKAAEAGLGKDSADLFRKAAVIRTTVTALATDLKVGSVDAAIVWRSTANQFQLHIVPDNDLLAISEVASACVMSETSDRQSAVDFINFLSNSDDARQVFSELQFRLPELDRQQEMNSK